MKELISVIIPTFKRPEKLLRAVKSVRAQTYKEFELIIINDDIDHSDINEMISKLDDNRLKLFSNSGVKGANGARNTGILKAKGIYLAFLDDDDEWMINNLESQLNCLRNTDEKVGLVYGGYLMENNSKWTAIYQNKQGDLYAEIILDKLYIGASSNIFIKKEIIKKVGLWDQKLARQQDLEFLIRVFKHYKAVYNPKLILKVYGHNDPVPEKSFHSREEFLNKVSHHLDHISEKQKALFLSNHYRRQAMYLIEMGDFKKSKNYWLKSFRNKKVSIKKDIKIAIALIKSLKSS